MRLRFTLPLYTDIDFQGHQDARHADSWGEACLVENLIAYALAGQPLGTVLKNHSKADSCPDGGWILWPHDAQRKLVVFFVPSLTSSPAEIRTPRCDMGLDWVDSRRGHYGVAYDGRASLWEGKFVSAPEGLIRTLMDQHSKVLRKALYDETHRINRDEGLYRANDVDVRLSTFLGEYEYPDVTRSAHAAILTCYHEMGYVPRGTPVETVDEIRRLLSTADHLWRQLPEGMQEDLSRPHRVERSLGYRLGWSLQAAEELMIRIAPKKAQSNNSGNEPAL